MSDSTTNLDLIAASQSQKEITANALFDAASPAMLYGRRALTSAGLTWGYYGGTALTSGGLAAVANGTLSLTASVTNYIEADAATGAVSVNTSGFSSGRVALYQVEAGAASVASYTDKRGKDLQTPSAAIAAHVAASDPHPIYLTQAEGDARYLATIPPQPFDLMAFYPGVPGASAKVTRVPVARAISFPANFSGSAGIASAAATGAAAFDVRKNGASVGTISFAAGATTATFTTAGGAAVSLASGDYISITAPATADATLADIGFVLAGQR